MTRKTVILLLFLVCLPSLEAAAQWSFDVVSVEAYINDHKKQRSLLLARSTLEYSNQLLHEYSREKTVDYKDLNAELDKYTRAFDVIDVLYQSLRTCMNVYSTYDAVSDCLTDYKNMLSDFNEKIIKRGKIELADTLIISINTRAIEKIADETGNLYKSVSELALYVTGLAACSTADLMVILDAINFSLDNIEKCLNRACFETWRYIQLRIGYWKEQVYKRYSKAQLTAAAFKRWRTAGRLDY